jgi:hypothetical protein
MLDSSSMPKVRKGHEHRVLTAIGSFPENEIYSVSTIDNLILSAIKIRRQSGSAKGNEKTPEMP